MKKINLIKKLHNSSKRNYIQRMMSNKIKCMKVAKRYSYDYWDGKRDYGYGGYKYIPGRWNSVAKKIIRIFKLNNKSKILDFGCGKGYLLYEIKLILPEIQIHGLDISNYAIRSVPELIKKNIILNDGRKRTKYKKKYFDLVISLGCLHNFKINEIELAVKEINRIGKKQYIMVESYRNDAELFNLQCWALTCQSFFSDDQWKFLYKKFNYNGHYEFIHFR